MAGAVTDRLTQRGLVRGTDGAVRCAWAAASADYRDYHDSEWGRPVRGDIALFERITLEAFQSGLSWITVLRKRPAFREAFVGFDPLAIAKFNDRDVERLMANSAIIRNRRKIDATILNARAMVGLWEKCGPLGLTELIWSHAPSSRARPDRLSDVPATSLESVRLSKALKHHGFTFIGPTTMYAAMQACGLVDDHVRGCYAGVAGGRGGGG